MIPDALAQLLISATQIHRQQLSLEERRVQLKALEMEIGFRNDRMNAQASLMRDLIHSLIDRSIDATLSGFNRVLHLYEVQNNLYVSERAKFTDAMVKSVDPLERTNLEAQVLEIDIQLERIEIAGRSTYQDLNFMLLAIGGNALTPATDFQRTLSI